MHQTIPKDMKKHFMTACLEKLLDWMYACNTSVTWSGQFTAQEKVLSIQISELEAHQQIPVLHVRNMQLNLPKLKKWVLMMKNSSYKC